MKKKNYTLLLILFISIMACQQTEKKSTTDTMPVPPEKVQVEQQAQTSGEVDIVPLPASIFRPIYLESDYMDIIFENLPFSMSQDNNASIRQILNYVDNKLPESHDPNCSLFAQLIVQKEAEIIMEADMFHSEGCYYFVLKYQGKTYMNGMTNAGIQFFENLKQSNF